MEQTAKIDIKDLLTIGFTFVVLGIGLAYGLQVLADVKADMTTNTDEWNAVGNTTAAVAKIPQKLGTVATIVMAAVIIGVLIKYLWVRFN